MRGIYQELRKCWFHTGLPQPEKEKVVAEDERVGGHHRLNGHESDQTLEDSEGQGSLVRDSLWGCKQPDTT